ncbi:Ribonuclease P protein component [Planctopirus ephydatiae]|jgi:ribonuclease P protein component|uniref:Ribonuclease P protein component n=1 Tax=Planctopirus ephydatiae TaxID=2528019 RepID=A0A518GP89_9PLAN|nr:ribonuclease P protein component [Planctopirus ephydatiae]QDV30417.1 Ribonuclease P protein component [Planctopirus ephydatiae]
MYRFVKAQHLRRPAEFELVYRHKQKVADGVLLVFARQRSTHVPSHGTEETQGKDLSITRLGLSVSKRRGNAVVRNREKRLIREAFRLTSHERPQGLDLIVVPIATTPLTLDQVKQSLVKLSRKLERRIPQASNALASAPEVTRVDATDCASEKPQTPQGSSE